MRTKIISAFPGTGKSTFHNKNKDNSIDSDSSEFSWVIDEGIKKRNPEFPANYINHIKENIGKVEFIFVSSHAEVREALLDSCLFFYLVYPDPSRKSEFIDRYKQRGNDDSFVKLLDNNWETWMEDIKTLPDGCKFINLKEGNLEDILIDLRK